MTDHAALALDPGKTTGTCFMHLRNGVMRLSVDQTEFSLASLHELLSMTIAKYQPLSIIYEDFQYRNVARMGLDLTPVKMIGVIELFRDWHSPFVEFTKQSPAAGKGFYTDERLRALGVFKTGKQHGRDATRHMLQWANFGAGGQYFEFDKLQLELV